MEQDRLEKFRAWFDDYVPSFYGDDEYVNANLKLKEDHSRRTCEQMLWLADALELDANQRRIAEVTALFHDIGRFRQFIKYRTYHDPRSIDHCRLGLQVLEETRALEAVAPEERELIEKAIEYHGLKELPKDLDGPCLLFSQLMRDADKLDVYYVVIENYRQYRDHPEDFMLEVELPDEPGYSPRVIEDIMQHRPTDYRKLRTLNDMKLLQLGWVYDVNFTATLRRIRQRKFLEMLIDFLPRTDDIDRVSRKVFEFVDSKVESDANTNRRGNDPA
jgi:hypothetical protein